eukprot:663022-Rhodomonas_salina.1
MMGRRRAILIVSTVPVLLLMVAALGRAAVQNHPVTLMEKDAVVLQKLDDDAGDHAFETHVTDQMRQLIKRAKKEKANAGEMKWILHFANGHLCSHEEERGKRTAERDEKG